MIQPKNYAHAVCFVVFCYVSIQDTNYKDVVMGAMASQITSLAIVYSTVNSGTDQRKHQSSASLAFVRGIHRWPVNSPHKWPVTRKIFSFDDVIMFYPYLLGLLHWQWEDLLIGANVSILKFIDHIMKPQQIKHNKTSWLCFNTKTVFPGMGFSF